MLRLFVVAAAVAAVGVDVVAVVVVGVAVRVVGAAVVGVADVAADVVVIAVVVVVADVADDAAAARVSSRQPSPRRITITTPFTSVDRANKTSTNQPRCKHVTTHVSNM